MTRDNLRYGFWLTAYTLAFLVVCSMPLLVVYIWLVLRGG